MTKKKNVHPNSLKNLRKIKSPEMAEEYRERGLETRRQNIAEKEAMKAAIRAYGDLNMDVPPAVEVLKIAMAKTIMENEMDEVTRLAALIAPYETPKLASKEVTVHDGFSDKTDEELAQLAAEFGVDLKELN